MGKLTIEQKAQAYDEALGRAREWYNDPHITIGLKGNLKDIFPELKESEDERIKKALLKMTNDTPRDIIWNNYGIHKEDAIAWFEKQGIHKHKIQPKFKIGDIIRFKGNETLEGEAETHKIVSYDNELYVFADGMTDLFCEQDMYELVEQKPDNKVKSKFHEGEWVVWNNQYYKVNYNSCGYELIDQNGLHTSLEYGTVDKDAHLWSIKDAKQGDVLASEDKVFIYNGKFDLRGRVCAYCGIYKTYDGLRFTECAIGNYFTYKEPHPATKEQRDTLLKAMADAGYTFDFEKKELKKIDTYCQDNCKGFQETGRCFCDGECKAKKEHKQNLQDNNFRRMFEQNPAEWSEEDKNRFSNLISLVKHSNEGEATKKGFIDFINRLKSIKDRVQSQQEWSALDENNILFLTSVIEECFKDKEKITLYGDTVCANFTKEDVIDRLKSLRPKKQWLPTVEQAKALSDTIRRFDLEGNEPLSELKEQISQIVYTGVIPTQKQWKPSKEQMEALMEAKLASTKNREYFLGLLYDDLKKLK